MLRSLLVATVLGASLIVASTAGAAITFEQDPSNEYTTGTNPYRLTRADFNGDGKADIAVANGTSSDVSVFLKNPGFGFAQEQGSPIPVGRGPSGIVAGDWNNDGRVDLATSDYTGSTVTSMLRQPGGGFAGKVSDAATGNASAIAVVGDYDGNGRPDVAVTERGSNALQLLLRRQPPAAEGFSSVGSAIATGTSPRAIAVGNFVATSPDRPDLVVTNSDDDTIRIYRTNPTTTGPNWWFSFFNMQYATDDNPQEIVAADFNNDGKDDVAVTTYGDGTTAGKVRVFTGDGTGVLTPEGSSAITLGKGAQGIAAADFDRDGRMDLAVSNHNDDTISILRRNNSVNGFDAPITIPTFDGPNGLIAGEFTGDNQPDLAVVSDNLNKLRVITNVTLGQPVNTARPQVTGVPSVGTKLSCSDGTWKNNPTLTKVWERAPRQTTADGDPAWAPIDGASGKDYTVQAADAGSRIHCRVDGVNVGGSATGYSASLRADVGPPANTRAPQALGTPIKGRELQCDPGDWTNGPTFSYRWLADGQAIPGATSATYTAAQDDNRVSCEVTADNDVGVAPPAGSNALHVVSQAPVNTAAPVLTIDGDVDKPLGRTATCAPGTWSYDDAQYTYRWTRNDETIAGETGATHRVVIDDLGERLQCFVTSTNPVGGTEAASKRVTVKLPAGTGDGDMLRSSPRNEFDPINMMAISKDYRQAVGAIVVERLRDAVDKETERCRTLKKVPSSLPDPFNRGKFALQPQKRCAALLYDAGNVDIGSYGVQYSGFDDRPCVKGSGNCASLNFKIAPVDPGQPGSLTAAQLQSLDAATPEKVLWDVNRDGRTDVTCPASAPVVRTMLAKGSWKPRAVIVAKDSAETGLFGSAELEQYDNFGTSTIGHKLRPGQPFACRTSLEPPPDPEQGPCVTAGSIGRVAVTGNLCPIYLRALDPASLKGLPPDVYKLLQTMAQNIALHKKRGNDIYVPMTDRQTTPWRAIAAAVSPEARRAAAAFANTASSLASINNVPSVDVSDKVDEALKKVDNFADQKANFALDQIYFAKGPVTVNGTDIVPNGDLPTLFVPSDAGNAMSRVKNMIINTPDAKTVLGGLELAARGQINTTFEDAQSQADAVLRQVNLDALKNLKLGPFKLTGADAQVHLNNDGTATLTAQASLPLLQDPSSGKPITMGIALKGDLSGNLKLQGVTLQAPGVLLGPLQLKDLLLRYDNGIQIQGKILLGPTGQGVDIRNFELTSGGQFKSLIVDYLAGAGTGIAIGPGIFLTKVGGGFDLGPPTRLNAAATISVGPSTGGGCPTAGIDSQMNLVFGSVPDIIVDVNGTVELACIPLGNFQFHADSNGYVRVDGHIDLSAGPLNLQANAGAAIALPNWQLTADASLRIRKLPIVGTIGPIEGAFALSNRGLAGCLRVTIDLLFDDITFSGGAAVNFPGGVPPLNYPALIANLRVFRGCDLSAYKPLGRSVVARGAQAGASQFKLPGGKGVTLLSIEGAGGAPQVTLRSPSGKTYDFTRATDPAKFDIAAGQIVEDEDRTVVFLKDAPKGVWTADPAPGSPSIARVESSRVIAQPNVKAKAGGIGASRTLAYTVANIPGQEVRFVEEASGATKQLGVVKGGGSGTLRYTTSEAKASKRTVIAQVSQDGTPRKNITVASYSAPNPTVGRPGSVRVRRSGTRAIVTWKKAQMAVGYLVSATTSDGRRLALYPDRGKTQVVVPDVARTEGLRVTVVGVSTGGRKGPGATATLAARGKSRKKG